MSELTLGTSRGSLLCEDLREVQIHGCVQTVRYGEHTCIPVLPTAMSYTGWGQMGRLETGQEFHSSRGLASPVHTALCDGVSCPTALCDVVSPTLSTVVDWGPIVPTRPSHNWYHTEQWTGTPV